VDERIHLAQRWNAAVDLVWLAGASSTVAEERKDLRTVVTKAALSLGFNAVDACPPQLPAIKLFLGVCPRRGTTICGWS